MRKKARANGISLKAYSGSTGVLLAMDVTAAKRKGLLGFAIERSGSGGHQWLNGLLDFAGGRRWVVNVWGVGYRLTDRDE